MAGSLFAGKFLCNSPGSWNALVKILGSQSYWLNLDHSLQRALLSLRTELIFGNSVEVRAPSLLLADYLESEGLEFQAPGVSWSKYKGSKRNKSLSYTGNERILVCLVTIIDTVRVTRYSETDIQTTLPLMDTQ